MDRHRSWIAGEGIPFVLMAGIPSVIFYTLHWFIPAVLLTLLTLFIVWFFRNPERCPPPGEEKAVSPADGKIIAIQQHCEREFIGDKGIKVSIFMNVLNVHVNRIPISGIIEGIYYRPGKFISANLDKASEQNERNGLVIRTPGGKKIVFIQIAGLIARRIVCWIKPEDVVERGARFGMIRFGSRVDVYLPEDTELRVRMGEHVKAGETVLGVLKSI